MPTRGLAFWLGMFLFSAYVLTFSGKLHVMDEFVGFAAGNNWVQHGRPDVNQYIWTNHWHSTPPGIWGEDGNLYTKKAPGISLAAAPFIWLGHTLPGLNAVHLSLLTCAIIAALTGSFLFIWLIDLRFSQLVATLTALAYGLCTIALVYARLLWEHTIIAFVFLIAAWAIHRAIYNSQSKRLWLWMLLGSMAMAVSLLMRFEAAAAVGLFGLYIFVYATPLPQPLTINSFISIINNKKRWLWAALYAILPFLTLLWLLYFNALRFGSASETGYNREILFEKPWAGTFGLLFSPSTGLFIYAPLMVLMFFGIRPVWRRVPKPYFWLIVLLSLFYWVFYGSWFSWGSTWVWGPRFLLHTLPLLMLFVAEPLQRLQDKSRQDPRRIVWKLAWSGVGLLALIGFFVNFLGAIVDLNEHFMRLGRNDNFVFNWEAFPPLGHWRILKEGLVDFIWLVPQPDGLIIDWTILLPALVLLLVSGAGLGLTFFSTSPSRLAQAVRSPVTYGLVLLLTGLMLGQMMAQTAQAALLNPQAQADLPVLQSLTDNPQPNDLLLIPLPPFGDVQEIAEISMAYLDRRLPTYIWIESEPRAIQPDERERLWQVAQNEAAYVWLFERWLTPDAPLGPTAIRYNQEAFWVEEQWFEQSGKLTLFALAKQLKAQVVPLNIPFQGGLTLVDFTVLNSSVSPGDVVKIRLTWQAPTFDHLADQDLPSQALVGFVHMLDETSGQNVGQSDRILFDLQHIDQSPLLPEQTISQGYGLQLPHDLSPGSYPLVVGLYTTSSGQRLHRADDSPDDFLYLTTIVVKIEGFR